VMSTESIEQEIRAERLADYAAKPLRRMAQIDVHQVEGEGDALMHPDADGDVVMTTSPGWEFNTSGCIRLMFPAGTPKQVLFRAATKMLKCIESSDPDLLDSVSEREEGGEIRSRKMLVAELTAAIERIQDQNAPEVPSAMTVQQIERYRAVVNEDREAECPF
jgi:hypothetical protein